MLVFFSSSPRPDSETGFKSCSQQFFDFIFFLSSWNVLYKNKRSGALFLVPGRVGLMVGQWDLAKWPLLLEFRVDAVK